MSAPPKRPSEADIEAAHEAAVRAEIQAETARDRQALAAQSGDPRTRAMAKLARLQAEHAAAALAHHWLALCDAADLFDALDASGEP